MIVVMRAQSAENELQNVINRLQRMGFDIHLSRGVERTIIGAVGDKKSVDIITLEALPGVEKVVPIRYPFKLASRVFKADNTIVEVGDVRIGGPDPVVMAGPCAVESEEQLDQVAYAVKTAGGHFLRGGAFKPRTSPYSFQGLEEEGLQILATVSKKHSLPVITEIVDPRSIELVGRYSDVLQVGARNMQNFLLLRELGRQPRPVLLKRGTAATMEEWLMAAEYIISGGNYNVILCERGIRTFETYTRNTLDLSAVPMVKELSHLPIIVDPSHGTGKRRLIGPMALAALAAGADGLMIETHPCPAEALSDGPQSLDLEEFSELMVRIKKMGAFLAQG